MSDHRIVNSGNDTDLSFKQLKKYVRVRSKPESQFIEFDFAISDPCLFVELIMPKNAFENFCISNDVIYMNSEQITAVEKDIEKWRYGDTTD